MNSNIIRRLSALLMVCVLMVSTAISASAANVTDTSYYKTNVSSGTWRATSARYKENNSKVYVYPSSSPSGKTKVKTVCYVGGVSTNKTKNSNGYVVLNSGSKYAITNYVYEDGDYTTGYGVKAWLNFTPTSGTGTLSGVWSPDWTGSGTGITIV